MTTSLTALPGGAAPPPSQVVLCQFQRTQRIVISEGRNFQVRPSMRRHRTRRVRCKRATYAAMPSILRHLGSFAYGYMVFTCAACASSSSPQQSHLVCGGGGPAFSDTGSIAVRLDRAAASTLHSLDLAIGPGLAGREMTRDHGAIGCPSKADSVQLSLTGHWTTLPVVAYSVPVYTRLTVTTPRGVVLDTLLDARGQTFQHVSWPKDK